jgi:hypothetical protein
MANLYSVTLTPIQDDSDERSLPKEIVFIATCHGAPDKCWNLASNEIAVVLESLFSPGDISRIEARLYSHESITLPTVYGPTELVQMGYRIRLETESNVPSTSDHAHRSIRG